MKAILITLPSNIEWSEYQKELDAVADGSQELNFKVATLPKDVGVGDRCYLVHRNYIVGWMTISYIGCKSFLCTTTEKGWVGKFISRTGPFHPIKPVLYRGFQGFRYIDTEDLTEN